LTELLPQINNAIEICKLSAPKKIRANKLMQNAAELITELKQQQVIA
jgi:hypothetical protein